VLSGIGTLAGFAITSHMQGVAEAVTLDSVAISSTEVPPPGLACPNTWTCTDIAATPLGGQTLSGTTWTVQGGGSDIYGTADSFHLVSQPLAGDGSISTHVASQTAKSGWAKAGPMLRASTDPSAPYYAILVTPANGVVVQWRKTSGAGTNQIQVPGLTTPVYLQVTRAGTTFSAATSSDGTTWTPVAGSVVSVPALTGTLLSGLAVTSHDATQVSTVVFTS
jgi:hypothetical protein